MYKRIPPITESTDVVKQRLQREHDGRNKPRFHMLYLLASGQATTRQDVAHVLGLSRNTVGRWLTWYKAGGRTALLNIYVPAGKQPCLPPAVLASVEQARHRPEGFAAYAALRQWIAQAHGVQVTSKTRSTMVRTRFTAQLNVPRPSHTHKR